MERYRVKQGKEIHIQDFDPNATSAFDGKKKDAEKQLLKLNEELEALQELLYAEGKHKLLVILQGMDASGKDGTIRHVFEGVNPQGVKVASFKVPNDKEMAHDYLWRIHQQTPGNGEIMIFNRSQYEDVLVVRVKGFVPEKVWKKRYQQINDFEKMLADEGTTILKFFLHIDKDEQIKRIRERVDDPSKHWKFNPGDLEDRKLWDQYQSAYEDVLNKTSTDWAPWYIVPANKKWYRNLIIASVMVETLKSLKMSYPENNIDMSQIKLV